jgi:L-rhamnose isomerase
LGGGAGALMEEMKTMPFGVVRDSLCQHVDTPLDRAWMSQVTQYEVNVLWKGS